MNMQVEVDVLTGATTILRSDLVYDCGQSLNPAVDLGQVSYQMNTTHVDHCLNENVLLL
jgi:xanthine dehydrogenase molybdopterin-binding subunit B